MGCLASKEARKEQKKEVEEGEHNDGCLTLHCVGGGWEEESDKRSFMISELCSWQGGAKPGRVKSPGKQQEGCQKGKDQSRGGNEGC